jgi:hypothetical protein
MEDEMKRMWSRTLVMVVGAVLLAGGPALAQGKTQPKSPPPPSCSKECENDTKVCTSMCKKYAKEGGDVCLKACKESEMECKNECVSK